MKLYNRHNYDNSYFHDKNFVQRTIFLSKLYFYSSDTKHYTLKNLYAILYVYFQKFTDIERIIFCKITLRLNVSESFLSDKIELIGIIFKIAPRFCKKQLFNYLIMNSNTQASIIVSLCNAYSCVYFDIEESKQKMIMDKLYSLSNNCKNEFIAESINHTIAFLKR